MSAYTSPVVRSTVMPMAWPLRLVMGTQGLFWAEAPNGCSSACWAGLEAGAFAADLASSVPATIAIANTAAASANKVLFIIGISLMIANLRG